MFAMSPVKLAEGVGLEPTYLATVCRFSRPVASHLAQPSAMVPAAGIEPAVAEATGFTARPQVHYEIADKTEKNKTRFDRVFLEAGLLLNLNPCICYLWIWEREPAPAY